MKTHWKIPVVCLQLLLVLGLLLGTQATVKADQFDEVIAAFQAGKYKKALEKLRPLAGQGHAEAQYTLGGLYDHGEGVPQDDKEAVKWYRMAAEQGYAEAQLHLAHLYRVGHRIPKDYTEATKWYRMAAEQGDANGQMSLGVMYYEGKGVPQDYVQAHKWSNLSASHQGKHQDIASGYRKIIEEKMTPAQVAEAQKLAREWKPKTWEELSQ